MRYALLGILGLAFGLSALAAEPADSTTPLAPAAGFVVVDDMGEKHEITAADFAKLPARDLKAKDHAGADAVYEGVAMEDVLRKVGVKLGKELRGPALANSVLIEAADKYRVVFALPELDSYWTDNVVLIAIRKDGKLLPDTHGPYQLVVPGDKRHGRWVKQVRTLTVLIPPKS